MSDNSLQEAEKFFVVHSSQDNVRNDGRGCFDYRTIELETNVIENLSGSALVKIGETVVLAGVRTELTTPLPHSPSKGWIEISIGCTPNADLEFEGRGGDDLASKVSEVLMLICNNDKVIDLKKLCVIPGEQVFVVYVDIEVVGYAGNFIDAASIATKAALFNTKIQAVTVKSDDNNAPKIEISDDPDDVFSLNVTNLPCLLTLNRLGTEFIIDATKEEEVCSKAKLLISVSPVGLILVKEIGSPGSLHVDSSIDIIQIGCEIGIKLHNQLNETLEEEKTTMTEKSLLL